MIAINAILLCMNGDALAQGVGFAKGNGLQGEYKSGSTTVKRIDPVVNFIWGYQGPLPTISADNFTVKWTGQVEAPVSGSYSFSIQADDSLRLWVDGKLVINAANGYYPSTHVGADLALVAGRKYDIQLEYAERYGKAAAQLSWRYPGQSLQVIPQSRLYSAPASSAPVTNGSAVPGSPVSLTAYGRWSDTCCGGKAMAHAELSWALPTSSPVAISTFNIYRDGALVKSGVTETLWKDMGIISGQTYAYQVSSVAASGRESSKSGIVTVLAPFASIAPPPSSGWTAPTNLRVSGLWVTALRKPTDVLTWDALANAVRYNIYQYDKLIAYTTDVATYTVPTAQYYPGMTYAVTAVNSQGEETLPSNIVGTQRTRDPATAEPSTSEMRAPVTLRAVTEWNVGNPRVRLTWLGAIDANTYDIYRDGVKVMTGIWGQNWFDTNVRVGEQHTYMVRGVNSSFLAPIESATSLPVTMQVTAKPVIIAGAQVTITQIVPNDDSVVVHFDAVPGAADYRVYEAQKHGSYKYSAGSLSIEMNGLTPGVPATLIVEAVDKLGPFQKMDGTLGPGGVGHDGHANMAVNGHGDPSNVPVAIATSEPFTVSCEPRVLTGSQVFFDTFRDSKPFKPAPTPPDILEAHRGDVGTVENDRWIIYNVRGDRDNSRAFVMSNHFMDALYDGGTPSKGGSLHQAIASLVMQPKAYADFSGDKVLHVTFEVDPHVTGRRWCDVFIAAADDPLRVTGSFPSGNQLPTVKGNMIRWEILSTLHTAQLYLGKDASGKLIRHDLLHQTGVPNSSGNPSRKYPLPNGMPSHNGSHHDLDKRHQFDLYISRNRILITEQGRLIKDTVFPKGVTLPFSRAAVYFVHQVYHSAAERSEIKRYTKDAPYFVNHRPFADERHWDNMGFEVVNSFPTIHP
ncbi:MAG: hypothetical protein H7145_11140 [Akkermansiaceae bacterium]|nr:hypothetical protein [Armatimonadota bacterium]